MYKCLVIIIAIYIFIDLLKLFLSFFYSLFALLYGTKYSDLILITRLPNQEIIKTLGEKKNYKDLEILEVNTIKQTQVKKTFKKECTTDVLKRLFIFHFSSTFLFCFIFMFFSLFIYLLCFPSVFMFIILFLLGHLCLLFFV